MRFSGINITMAFSNILFFLFSLLLCFLSSLQVSLSAIQDLNSLESVPDLENSMYMAVVGYPCVRLLNLSGEIGCSNPGREKVVVPPVKFGSADKLFQSSAILVPLLELESLFNRISNDLDFAKHVAGVLVESRSELGTDSKEFSPDEKFPLAEFSPYQNSNYQWNPTGSGIMWKNYNFPVYLLPEGGSSILTKVAMENERRQKAYTADVVEFDVVMETTKGGTRDSKSCLRLGTCLPLGGYSVWSALPPIIKLPSESSKHIILAVASMDSASFFRDKSVGADSHLSGLISLIVAVDALSKIDGLTDLSKQLVFVFFTGEAWGYLGSRRFLLELDDHSDSLDGLNSTLIDTVVEVGSVGKGTSQGINNFFAHTTQASAATNKTLDALKLAQDSLHSSGVKVSAANASNPGIPPSSLMSFLWKNPQISGFVLEDFDTAFTNQFYHSHLDVLSNINSSSIVASASLIARTLYILASDKEDLNITVLNSLNVNGSLAEELISCLLMCDPGLSCDLIKRYISPSTTSCPSHYVGVVLGEPSSAPYAGYVNDVPRFLWNFLAEKTSIPSKNAYSSCPKNCSNVGESCIKVESDGKGVCVVSSTRYVPAYSTRLKFESEMWTVLEPNSSDPMGMADPVWTESNWDVIRLRVYTKQDGTYDLVVLVAGITVTVLAYVAILITQAFIAKAMKQD